jgi:iron(III) transport system permease protein
VSSTQRFLFAGVRHLGAWLRGALALCILVPAAACVWLSVGGTSLQFDGLRAILSADAVPLLVTSLRVATVATLITALLAIPLTIVLVRTNVWGASWWTAIWSSWLVLPPYLLAMGVRALVHPSSGWLPVWLRVSVENEAGVIGVLGVAHVPLLMLAITGPLRAIDVRLDEAVRVAGGSSWRSIVDVSLPVLRAPIVGGVCAAWVASLASFGVVALLGAPAQPSVVVLTTRIVGVWMVGTETSLRTALWWSFVLVGLGATVFAIGKKLGGRSYAVVSGKPARSQPIDLRGRRVWVSIVVAAVTITCALAPLLALLRTATRTLVGGTGVTAQHMLTAWQDALAQRATLTSVLCAMAAAGLAFVVGQSFTAPTTRPGGHARKWLRRISDAVWATPGTMVALALVVTSQRDIRMVLGDTVAFRTDLVGSVWILVVAYWVKHTSMTLRSVEDAAAQIDPSLADAARVAGAPKDRAYDDAVAPLLVGAAVAGAVAVWLSSLLELTMSALLQSERAATIGVVVFQQQDYGNPQAALAAVLSIVAVGVQTLMGKRRKQA